MPYEKIPDLGRVNKKTWSNAKGESPREVEGYDLDKKYNKPAAKIIRDQWHITDHIEDYLKLVGKDSGGKIQKAYILCNDIHGKIDDYVGELFKKTKIGDNETFELVFADVFEAFNVIQHATEKAMAEMKGDYDDYNEALKAYQDGKGITETRGIIDGFDGHLHGKED